MRWWLVSLVCVIGMGLGTLGPARAADPDLATPEGAVAAYLDGVARQDFVAILAATAVDRRTEGFDFVRYIDRIKALTNFMPAPATSPLFKEINRARSEAEIGKQVQFLAYSLMTNSPILANQTVRMTADEAAQFASVVRAERLGGLQLVRVGRPDPAKLDSARYQEIAAGIARPNGADATTERVALVSFEGSHFAVGFTLLRYGEDWLVMSQTSALYGLDPSGVAARITPEEFERSLSP